MFRNLLALGEKERLELRKAVDEAGGKVYVVVHPLWTGSKTARRNLERLTTAESAAPLVVFETEKDLFRTLKLIKQITPQSGQRKIVFVKTADGFPDPLLGWGKAFSALEEIGARHVAVAGQMLDFWRPDPVFGKSQGLEERMALESRKRLEVARRWLKAAEAQNLAADKPGVRALKRTLSRLGLVGTGKTAANKRTVRTLNQMAEYIPGGCAGTAYGRLLESKRFKSVTLLPRWSLPVELRLDGPLNPHAKGKHSRFLPGLFARLKPRH